MTNNDTHEEWLSAGAAAKRMGGITTRTLRSILIEEGVEVIHIRAGNFRVRNEDIERLRTARLKPLT